MPHSSTPNFTLDTIRRRLLRGGEAVALGDRAFDLLLALAEGEGAVVPAAILIGRVWPGVTVGPGNLRVQVRALRRALGDDAVDYVAGEGYRLSLPLVRPRDGLPQQGAAEAVFVGRGQEMARLREMLERSRLVSLVGPGGVGKTRLAFAVLAEMPAQRVAHVELAAIRLPGLVAAAVAASLSVRLLGADALSAIAAAVRDEPTLLLLDNAEHLLDEVAEFAEALLGVCPAVRLLLTSREPLGISGETIFRLGPLACPPDMPLSPDDIRAYPAIALILRCCGELGAVTLADADLPVLARLCRHLDGLPLALLLLSARLRDAPIRDVADALEGRFQSLPLPDIAGSRHGNLAQMLDWSFDQLSADERLLLGRLSLFAGPWVLSAAVAVCGGAPLERDQVAGLVASLVARSLVMGPQLTDHPRFHILETIRDYAGRLPGTATEQAALRPLLARWLNGRMAEASLQFASTIGREPWRRLYLSDIADVREAVAWCFAPGGDVTLGQMLIVNSHSLWQNLGSFQELGDLLQQAHAAISDRTPPLVAAVLDLTVHGEWVPVALPHYQNRAAFARNGLEGALAVLEAEAGPVWLLDGLLSAGWIHHYSGDQAASERLFHRARMLADEHGMVQRSVNALSLLGGFHVRRGDHDGAWPLFERALVLAQAAGLETSVIQLRLADGLFNAGNVDRAIAMGRAGLAADEGTNTALTQTLLANLSTYLLLQERLPDAVPLALEALRITRRFGYTYAYPWTLERGAHVAARLGDRVLARELAALAVRLIDLGGVIRPHTELRLQRLLLAELGEVAPANDAGDGAVEQALSRLESLYEGMAERGEA